LFVIASVRFHRKEVDYCQAEVPPLGIPLKRNSAFVGLPMEARKFFSISKITLKTAESCFFSEGRYAPSRIYRSNAQQCGGEIFDGLRRLTLRASEVRPQVQVFEDVHWMDRQRRST
jgi:hypothetical protein